MSPLETAALAARFAPRASDVLETLPAMAEGLHAQLLELHERPSRDRCERLAANLAGAQTTLRKLQEALQREAIGSGQ